MSSKDFRGWLLNEHVHFAHNLPGLEKYTANLPIEENNDALHDAVSELYFEDKTAIQDAFGSKAGEEAAENVAANCSSTSRLICEEKSLF